MDDTVKRHRGTQRWLVVMAKEPRAGAVKSRLAREIGAVAAIRFYRCALFNVLGRLSSDARWRTLLAITPDTAVHEPVWPVDCSRVCQGSGDLSDRMQRLFVGIPAGPVVIVGTDIPQITPTHIASAFDALGCHDAVIGPGEDGGYWLIGLRSAARIRPVFANVRWSSPHTLSDTLGNMTGMRVAILDTLADVDTKTDYRRLGGTGSRLILPPR